MMVAAKLKARHSIDREAIVSSLWHQQVEDWKTIGREVVGPRGLKPGQYLPLWLQQAVQAVEQRAVPGASGHDQTVGLVHIALSRHPHPLAKPLPLQHPLTPVDLGAECLRSLHIGDDAAFGRQEAALWLKHRQCLMR